MDERESMDIGRFKGGFGIWVEPLSPKKLLELDHKRLLLDGPFTYNDYIPQNGALEQRIKKNSWHYMSTAGALLNDINYKLDHRKNLV